MSFLFNFEAPDDCNSETENDTNTKANGRSKQKDHKPYLKDSDLQSGKDQSFIAKEVTDFPDHSFVEQVGTKGMVFGDHCFKVIDTVSLEKVLLEDAEFKVRHGISDQLHSSVSSHNDLTTGVYEGGLKVWECGIDLVEFLETHALGQDIEIKKKSVLELGCGAGLPGLYCIKCGAKRVDFQDYNEEVLQLLTQPNVGLVTSGDDEESCFQHYFSGDWGSFSELAEKQNLKYDIILSAETIYNTENYWKLQDVFKSALTDDGIIILTAKTYYFGVGGGVDSFLEFIESQSQFTAEVVHSIGSGVPRKVIFLRRSTQDEHSALPQKMYPPS